MLIVFQILFTIFSLYAITTVMKKREDGLLGMRGIIFWVMFWSAAIVIVLWPESTSAIAKLLGIGRGTDLVLYASVAALFFLIFRLHIKIETIGRDITKLVRERAVERTRQFDIDEIGKKR